MPEPVQPTSDTTESLLVDLDHRRFVAFVVDLYERTGHETEQRGNVVTAVAPDGDRERLLVWTDDRNRIERLLGTATPDVDVEAVDAVVSRDRDVATAAAIAAEADADLLQTTDLHGRLLYAMDRETCRNLCQAHFGRAVEPRPAPAEESENTALGGLSKARIGFAALIVCSLIVVGAMGLPVSVTPDRDVTVPGGGATADPTGSGPVTPVRGAPGATPAPTPAPPPTMPPTNRTPTVTPAPPSVSDPTITNATAIDLKDGDGVVADGDLVEIRANITDNDGGVERVFAVGGENSTERVPLNSTDNSVYSGTFRVDAADIGSSNVYPITIVVEDVMGNYARAGLNSLDTAFVNVTGSLGEESSAGAKTVFARIHDTEGGLPPDGSFISETLTDASGSFTLRVPANGTYDIVYWQGDFPTSQNLVPRDGIPDVFAMESLTVGESDVSLGDQAPPAGHDLNVSVIDESGNPVQGARIAYVHTENDSDDSALASLPVFLTNVDGLVDVSDFETTARGVAGLEVAGNVTVLVAPPGSNVRSTNRIYTRTITMTEDDRITVTINETASSSIATIRSGSAQSTEPITGISAMRPRSPAAVDSEGLLRSGRIQTIRPDVRTPPAHARNAGISARRA